MEAPLLLGCCQWVSARLLEAYVENMWTVLIILLVVWAVLAVVGFAIKGLFWLAVIGIILFVGTIIFGLIRNRARGPRSPR